MGKKVCGIYCIENAADHRKYIGYAVDIYRRWNYHRSGLRNNNHVNSYLQNAWNKYGEGSFYFWVVEECQKEFLVEREQYYIAHFESRNTHSGYNLNDGGYGNMGWLPTEETLARKSASVLGENNPMWGKKHSEETRKLLSSQRVGNKNGVGNKNSLGRTLTPESKGKLIASLTGKPRSPETKRKLREQNLGKKRQGASSMYVGVVKTQRGKWKGRINVNGKAIHLGTFISEIDAARAYNEAAIFYYGDDAILNDLGA